MTNLILGLGTAVPSHQVSQDEALRMTTELVSQNERQSRFLKVLFRGAGVNRRHTVVPWQVGYAWKKEGSQRAEGRGLSTAQRMRLYQQLAPPLAHEASARALQEAALPAAEVTHLVTVSCTGFSAPGVDLSLFESLSLPPTVQRVHVGYMGCHGAINGLRTARGIAASEPNGVVLLCAVETCSLHYRLHWDAEGVKGNALFADGAAAVVLADRPEAAPGWTVRGTGSCLLPDSREEMSWTIGDHGFEMRLTGRVPVLIEQHLKPWMSSWLAKFGLALDDIHGWGIHPGGPKIVEAAERALDLPPRACRHSREILRELGNMSSPTVLFVLDRLRKEAQGPVVLLGFGPGLTAEAVLLAPTG